MNKLIEIAKANGADVGLHPNQPMKFITFTDDQLRATVEQVCAPLVDLLEFIESKKGSYAPLATQQLEEFRALIGDKHE